ncbi:MAG TPA: SRPBCC domain-containing protein [Vicinamibacterales bacterium]|nr:SRPBCC domain-containing protein [Vicinamibacterales bacterium]
MKKAVTVAALLVLSAGARGQTTADEPSFVNEGVIAAPIADVWRVWSTSDGYKRLGVALAAVDLRVGGLIRSRYAADGLLGDEQTIENEILAYEPPRMIAFRIHKTPANFPFKEAWKHTWTVVTLTPLPDGRTHVRGASLGYGSDPESLAMRRFFERGNQQTIDALTASFSRSK